ASEDNDRREQDRHLGQEIRRREHHELDRPGTVTATAVATPTFRTTNTIPTVKRSVARTPLTPPVVNLAPKARTVCNASAATISVRVAANCSASFTTTKPSSTARAEALAPRKVRPGRRVMSGQRRRMPMPASTGRTSRRTSWRASTADGTGGRLIPCPGRGGRYAAGAARPTPRRGTRPGTALR